MSKFKKTVSSLSFNLISSIVILIIFFSLIVSTIGYASFTRTLKREYKNTTYHMAETATGLVDGNKIDAYLAGSEDDAEYAQIKEYLDSYCNKMNVTLLYVLKVDENLDYNMAYNVFDLINRSEDKRYNPDGKYSGRKLGETVKGSYIENYKETYKEIYEGKIECGIVYRLKNLKSKSPHITVVVPIKDDSGKVTAVLSVQRPMSELVNGTRPYMITIAISAAVLSIFVCIIAYLYTKFKVVKPIEAVIFEAKHFASHNEKTTSLNKKSKILEIKDLAISIDKMEDDMIKYIDSLTKATTEQKRMSVELNIAKSIQEGSVPNEFPAFPNRKDFDLYASMHPAKEVGGDFYNFALLDDNHLALVMADVSGKGIPAALFMMVSNILLTERLRAGDSPADALSFVNNRICSRNVLNMFVTIWVGILDLSTGKLIASNAGHDDLAIYRKNGKFEIYKEKHGIIVGAMPDAVYTNYEIDINKGDKIFLYTDGVVEATNNKTEMFKVDRMLEVLNKLKNKNPMEILNGMKKSVDDFVGSAPQFDDITMLCVELKED